MLLYHISFNHAKQGRLKRFIPRIPTVKGQTEEGSIPRICFSSSIEGALSGCPYSVAELDTKEGYSHSKIIMVYTVNTEQLQKSIIPPSELYRKGYILDAYRTSEYWVQEELILTGKPYRITNFEFDSCLEVERPYLKEHLVATLEKYKIKEPTRDLIEQYLLQMSPIEFINYLEHEESVGELTFDMVDEDYQFKSSIVLSCVKVEPC